MPLSCRALTSACGVAVTRQQGLRYGENPHQSAAFYRRVTATPHALVNARQLNGKPLSYNNLLDTDACWTIGFNS